MGPTRTEATRPTAIVSPTEIEEVERGWHREINNPLHNLTDYLMYVKMI